MSGHRFKSRDDYFNKRSGLTQKLIESKPKVPLRQYFENTIPVSLVRDMFCSGAFRFELESEGRFTREEISVEKAIEKHLSGEDTLLVNPLSEKATVSWSVVCFYHSNKLEMPFSKVIEYTRVLLEMGIPSLVEVTEAGKGNYHVWIFHENPVPGKQTSESLVKLGLELFDTELETVPSLQGETYLPLPLQGESMLLQRRVFVNSVGKMIKDQREVIAFAEVCPADVLESLYHRTDHDIMDSPEIKTVINGEAEGTEFSPGAILKDFPMVFDYEDLEIQIPVESTELEDRTLDQEALNEEEKPDETIEYEEASENEETHEIEELQENEEQPQNEIIEEIEKPVPVLESAKEKRIEPPQVIEKQNTVPVFVFRIGKTFLGMKPEDIEGVRVPGNIMPFPGDAGVFSGISFVEDTPLVILNPSFFSADSRFKASAHNRLLLLKGKSSNNAVIVDGTIGFFHGLPSNNAPSSKKFCSISLRIEELEKTIDVVDIAQCYHLRNIERAKADPGQYLCFEDEEFAYGIPVQWVKEIIPVSGRMEETHLRKHMSSFLRIVKKPQEKKSVPATRIIVVGTKNTKKEVLVKTMIGIKNLDKSGIISFTDFVYSGSGIEGVAVWDNIPLYLPCNKIFSG